MKEKNYIVDGNFYTTPFRVCGKSKYENSSIAENLSANENKTFLKSDIVKDGYFKIEADYLASLDKRKNF